MQNSELTTAVLDASEPLLRVESGAHPDAPDATRSVSLTFADGSTLFVGVTSDTDEICVEENAEDRLIFRDISSTSPWNRAIGHPLLWVWWMRNQQGYSDGLQLTFGATDQADSCTIQFMAGARTLQVVPVALKA